jgi:predicted Rdx family selenoprotein
VLVCTWMDFEVVASFAADLDVLALEMGTWSADSRTGGNWDIAVHRSSILIARGRSSSQRGSSGTLITAY